MRKSVKTSKGFADRYFGDYYICLRNIDRNFLILK